MMKKIIVLILLVSLSSTLFPQEKFNVNINRLANKKGSPIGGLIPLSVSYNGEKKGTIKKNSSLSIEEVIPADSIIELSFRKGNSFPTKFFLYPNGTFDYKIDATIGLFKFRISDKSVYPGIGTSDAEVSRGGNINKKNLAITYTYERSLKSDDIRKQWQRQGGKITGRSLSYVGSFSTMKTTDVGSTTTIKTLGGGWNYTQNRYNLKIPEYKPGIAKWSSLVYGMGMSINLNMSQMLIDFEDNSFIDDMDEVSGAFLLMFTPNVGYTLGLGKFKTERDYKGFALDITYKPSLIFTLSEAGTDSQLNYMGFGLDLSRNNFSAFASRLAPKAKSKFTFFMLPPLGDTPLIVTFGYGLVWYR